MQLRNDFLSFLHRCFQTVHPGVPFDWNWHHDALCQQLLCVLCSQVRRLIVNLPPRSLKSFITSVVFPAWVLGLNPGAKIFVISYGTELADKHASDFKSIVTSDWYKRAF